MTGRLNSKYLIIFMAVFSLLLFCVSGVCAQDTNNMSDLNNNLEKSIIFDEEIESLDIQNENYLSAGIRDLQDEINNASDGDVINITQDISGFSVTVNKEITIDGQGHTVKGNPGLSAFYSSSYARITLKNLNIIGYHTTNGGAINIMNNARYTIINCNFSNNVADEDGGAIYNGNDGKHLVSDNLLIIINCSFTNNRATTDKSDSGGAIYSLGSVNIENSIFKSNSASAYAGAIYSKKTVNIVNSTFENNHAGFDGGCIYSDHIIINEHQNENQSFNTFFRNNEVGGAGGAIGGWSFINIVNTEFTGNKAFTGGAIEMCGEKVGIREIRVTHCLFKSNKASGSSTSQCYGGAINFGSLGLLNINNCTFEDNYADDYGGAAHATYINIDQNQNSNQSHSSFFINNNVKDNKGGALYAIMNISVKNAVFEGNSAYVDGGAFYAENYVDMKNTTFRKNKASGASLAQCYGGAVRVEGLVKIDNCTFEGNHAADSGGAIYADTISWVDSPSYFIGNYVDDNKGGAIYTGKFDTDVSYGVFINNAVNANDDGGAICINNENHVTFSQCYFENNHCGDEGGAIYLDSTSSELSLRYNIFVDNKADDKGQIVYNCGVYKQIEKNWYGINNPDFSDKFKELHKVGSDEDHSDTDPLLTKLSLNGNPLVGEKSILEVDFITSSSSYMKEDLFNYDVTFAANNGALLSNYQEWDSKASSDILFTRTGITNMTAKINHQVLYLSCSPFRENTVWYVNGSKASSGDGTSDQEAFKTLAEALNVSYAGHTIMIASGEYTGNNNTNLFINKNLTFMKYGDAEAIFDGGGLNRILDFHAESINITDLTFRRGNADSGGAIYFSKALSDSNINATFIDNSGIRGGAIYFADVLTNVNISGNYINNSAQLCSALYLRNNLINVDITGVFLNNTGNFVISINGASSDSVIHDSIFINNNANRIAVLSSNIPMRDNWFGNNATNYNEMPIVSSSLDNWLFLNATANPNGVGLNQRSAISFNLFSYSYKGIIKSYDASKMNVLLNLYPTLGLLNQNTTLIGEDVLYTAKQSGNATITGQFETAYYTIAVKNLIPTEIKNSYFMLELELGDEVETGAILIPADAGNLTYDSSNENIAIVENGKIIALGIGETDITVSFAGNDEYAPALNKTIIIIVKDSPIMYVTAENVIKYYGGLEQFVVNVTNIKGKAVVGQSVLITINGKTYNRVTDMNGTVYLDLNLPSGTYNVNTTVSNITVKSVVNILPTIAGENVESDLRHIIYQAKLIDSEGKSLENGTKVESNINGTIYSSDVNMGMITLDLILNSGKYVVTVTNPVTGEKHTNNITVNAKNPNINVTTKEITVGENATILVTGLNNATGNVSVSVNSKTYTAHIKNGTAKVIIPDLNETTEAVVSYSGDDKYNNASASVRIVVNPVPVKDNLTIGASCNAIVVGEDATVVVIGLENATGNVSVSVNSKTYNAPIKNGTAKIIIHGLNETVVANVYYGGDDKYNNESTTVRIVVNPVPVKDNLTINASCNAIVVGEDATVVVTGLKNATGNVSVSLNGKTYTAPIKNGTAKISIPDLNETAEAVISYSGDDKYNNASNSVRIVVNPQPVPPKEDLNVSVVVDQITVGEDAVIVVSDLKDATGNVTVVVNGKTYTAPINDGKATINVSGLTENATAVVSYPGDDKYNNFTESVDIVVNPKEKENTTIRIDVPDDVTEGDNVTVTVTLPEDATGSVNIGNDVVPLVNGTASAVLTNLPVGNTTVPITYSGDDKYNSIETSITINADEKPVPSKENLTISATADPITVGENATILVTGFEDATGTVTAKVGNGVYTASIVDGVAIFTISGLIENLTAEITYAGDDKYNNASTTVDIVINPKPKENATMNIDVPPVTEGQNTTVNVKLPEDATGNVTVTVGGKTYTAPVIDGKATITIPELAAGNYTLPVTYSGDDKYNPLTEEVNITVDKDKSDIISAPDVTKYYKGSERFVVNITDYKGSPVANKSVTISINGVSYDRKTNANGTASIALGLNSGTYNVTVTVDNETINSVVTILPTVNGTDVVKVYRNATQYYATFRDSEGNYLKEGTSVRFNINGVFYDRKVTGSEGLAKLNLNLEQGMYVITAMNLETGEMGSNNITIIPRLVENKDITKYYRNATQYTVKVLGDDGNPVGAGENVTFNIKGVFYTRTTDASGIAKLNLNLQPGDYIITAEYKN